MVYIQLSVEQVMLTDLLEHFTKDDLYALGIKYVHTYVCTYVTNIITML